jgi:hypothetical protein
MPAKEPLNIELFRLLQRGGAVARCMPTIGTFNYRLRAYVHLGNLTAPEKGGPRQPVYGDATLHD